MKRIDREIVKNLLSGKFRNSDYLTSHVAVIMDKNHKRHVLENISLIAHQVSTSLRQSTQS